MAIYLDTSVLPWHGDLESAEFSALRAVAGAHNQKIILPGLVVPESTANRKREIERGMQAVEQAIANARWIREFRYSTDDNLSSALSDEWRRGLRETFTEIPLSGNNAIEAMLREIARMPPAHVRDGKGARDAAIWLTIRDHHLAQQEPGYFVSRNKADFADGSGQLLHPSLAKELIHHPYPLQYAQDPAALLDLLSPRVNEGFQPDELQSDSSLIEAVRSAADRDQARQREAAVEKYLTTSWPPVGLTMTSTKTYPTSITLLELLSARAYTFPDDRSIAVLTTRWALHHRVEFEISRLDEVGAQKELLNKGDLELDQAFEVQIWGLKPTISGQYNWDATHLRTVGRITINAVG